MAAGLNPSRRWLGWLALSVGLVLLGGFGAQQVQTSFGEVTVTARTYFTDNGQWVRADFYQPKSASSTNRVPLVMVCPGFERSKETMSSYSIELSRRGLAVLVIDPYNQGASSTTRQRRSASREGYGLIPVLEQIWQQPEYDFIDWSRVGAAGYSAGGNAVLQSASLFGGRQAKALRTARRLDSEEGRTITPAERAAADAENKLFAVFVGGYVLTMRDDVLDTVNANVGTDYARWDEGAFRNTEPHADMRKVPESLRLVNSTRAEGEKVTAVDLGQYYGSAAERTLRVVHNTSNIHPVLPYDHEFVGHMLNFFQKALMLPPWLPATDQVWQWKELFTGISLLGGLLFIVPFTALLLRWRPFAPLVHPVPPPLPKPEGKSRWIFWGNFIFAALVACFIFVPLAHATIAMFPTASSARPTWWFPQRINNAILLWAVANGLLGLLLFSLNWRLHGRHRGITPAMWGIATSAGELFRALILALIVTAGFFGLVFACHGIFHTDFRFVFVAATAEFPPKMLLVALMYLPLFFIFYLANSIRANSAMRFAGQPEWQNLLLNGIGNSAGLLLIVLIQYGWLFTTGQVFWTDGWLYVNLLLGVIPMMFILPFFHRAFFRLTGKVWLGPMVMCLIFVLMMLTNNVCYIPLR